MSTESAFAQLGVPAPLSSALKAMRFNEPFEIQALTIPDALDGHDILGRAPTGSGKTLAFGLPQLARITQAASGRPTGLILAPTRELAEQIRRELEPLATAMHRTTLAVYGGKGLGQQRKALSKGVDLLVACPGRLLDLIEQRIVNLGDVEVAVVDEADRMADMGFLPDVKRILDLTPETRQTMLYSATLDNEVQVLIDKYQTDPIEHAVAELEPDLSLLTHRFIKVPKTDRIWLAADLITDLGMAIVFVRTRHGVDRLARQLQRHGVKAAYIHGGRSQSQRDRALSLFTSGNVQALVATDVAARGIHVDGVECVLHYDPPAEYKDYVHRSGRTARAGATGVVVSLLDKPQVKDSMKMQLKLGIEADLEPMPERQHFLDAVASGGSPNRQAKGKSGTKVSSRGGSNRSSNGDGRRRKSGKGDGEKVPRRRPTQVKSRSGANSTGDEESGGHSGRGGSKSSRPNKGKAGSRSRSNTRSKSESNSRSKSDGGAAADRSGGERGSGKASARPGKKSAGKRQTAGASSKPKRSGKPRPKNRKNKAGGRNKARS